MKMTLSYQYLAAKIDLLDQFGFPRAQAFDALEIQPMDIAASHKRMCIDTFTTCLELAAKVISEPHIGLRLGHKFRVGTFGKTGSLYGYCETVEEVISMNNLYQKVAIDIGQVEYMKPSTHENLMCFTPYYSDLEKYRQITDMIMASYMTTYQWLSWGSGETLTCVHLPYLGQDDVEAYSDILQMRVVADSNHIAVEAPDAVMLHKITTQNPERLAQSRVVLDRLLGKQLAFQSFEDAVGAAIRGAIEDGQVTSEIVSKRMGLSNAALRAQLAKTGEGFRPRLDKIRKALFIEKFEAGSSFSQIATDLAYNDQAAMNRAFQRWFNMTPTQWRTNRLQSKSP